MSATAQPKFSIWLGDNWPGPYVVTYELRRGRALTVVVNGATSCEDALALAKAEHRREPRSAPLSRTGR